MSNYPPPQGPYDPSGAQPQYGGQPQYGSQPQWPPPGQPPYPGQQPWGGPPRRSRTPIVIVSVIGGVVVLAIALVFVYVFAFKGTTSSGASAEDQIRTVIKNSQDAYNRADATAFASYRCHQSSMGTPPTSDELRKSVDEDGQLTLTVDNITVTGDRATGIVTERYSKSTEMDNKKTSSFVREGGDWKFCGPLNSDDTGTRVPPTP